MRALMLVAALIPTLSWAATAYFTGNQEIVTTVTGQVAWRCEYDYAGQKFWRLFKSSCPISVEVY